MAGIIRKRDYFSPEYRINQRIGNDILIMDRGSWWQGSPEPFIADVTTAIFLTKGCIDISISMTSYTAKAPCMIVYMEGMIVRQESISPDARMDVMILSKTFTDEILTETNVYGQLRSQVITSPVFPLRGQEKIPVAFYFILQSLMGMRDSPYRLEAVRHMALTLFYGFALGSPTKETAETISISRCESITRRFLSILKDNYRLHRSVAFYASEMCMTPKYLSQSVKEATGRTALEWIDDHVCAEAKALLRSTDLSVERIGEELGFSSQSLFGKYFKRVTGISPRAYRSQ